MCSRAACVAVLVAAVPAAAFAQSANPLAEPLVTFVNASSGVFGDEGPRVSASLDAIDIQLAAWDAAVRRAEAGLASDIRSATPDVASQMLTAIGAVYLQRGRLADGARQLRAAAALNPNGAATQELLALALDRSGDAAAADAWRRAYESDTRDPAVAYFRARAALAGHAADGARAPIDTLVGIALRQDGASSWRLPVLTAVNDDAARDPVFAPAIYAAALPLLSKGDYDGAVRALHAGAAHDPLVAEPATRSTAAAEGIAALRNGDLPAALQRLRQAAADAPQASEIHRVLAMTLWADQQVDAARGEFEAAIRLRPDDERAFVALADMAVEGDDVDRAVTVLKRAVAAVPQSGQAHWRLAQIAERQHRDGDALAEYEACAGSPPMVGAGRVYAAIGRLYQSRPDLDAAARAYDRWTALQPGAADAHRALAAAYTSMDRNAEALVEQLAATLIEPRDAAGYAAVAQALLAVERDDDAERAARRALSLDPDNKEARYTLSVVLASRGHHEESTQELAAFTRLQQQALAAERQTFAVNSLKLQAQIATDPAERAAAWRQIVELEKPTADNERRLGDALAAAGRVDDAIGAYRMAVTLGKTPSAYRALIALYDKAGRRDEADAARAEFERTRRDRIRRLGAAP